VRTPTCRCSSKRGRTHQIRLHLSHQSTPVVGDPVYGGRFAQPRGAAPELVDSLRAFKRQALHAASLGFDHPRSGKRLVLKSPVPEDFRQLLLALRDDAGHRRRPSRACAVSGLWFRASMAGAGRRACIVDSARRNGGGGASKSPYACFNLGDHVGDNALAVAKNRRMLSREAGLPAEPSWLAQVHGVTVADLDERAPEAAADAAMTRRPGKVCVILAADCLPIVFCDGYRRRGWPPRTQVGAGWQPV